MVSALVFFGVQVIVPTLIWSVFNMLSELLEDNLKYQPETALERWGVFELPKAFIGVSLGLMVSQTFLQARSTL